MKKTRNFPILPVLFAVRKQHATAQEEKGTGQQEEREDGGTKTRGQRTMWTQWSEQRQQATIAVVKSWSLLPSLSLPLTHPLNLSLILLAPSYEAAVAVAAVDDDKTINDVDTSSCSWLMEGAKQKCGSS